MTWTVETLNTTVDDELDALHDDMKARFVHISSLIESVDLDKLGRPHVRHLDGPLWEIRLRGRSGIARAVYVTARDQRVVVVRVFVKKTEKTPVSEIKLAMQRAQEVLQ